MVLQNYRVYGRLHDIHLETKFLKTGDYERPGTRNTFRKGRIS